jgi:hypothetical protein
MIDLEDGQPHEKHAAVNLEKGVWTLHTPKQNKQSNAVLEDLQEEDRTIAFQVLIVPNHSNRSLY